MRVNEILKTVLLQITPDSSISEAEIFLDKIRVRVKLLKLSAKPVFGGSYAKNTWLKGDYDVDIFVKFDMKYHDKDLSLLLENILKPFNPEKIHGSRDYFHIKNFEIIPVLDIKNSKDAHNVTDFSPLHVSWVNKNNFKNDIRLTKKFMKAQGIYGAESYINGFSGHVVDILTINYKGFLNLLKNVSKWGNKTIIDPEKHYKNPEFQINKSKFQGPLLIVDPVQPDRNSSAAVNNETYDKFVKASKSFLKNPSLKFFSEEKIDLSKLKGNKLIFNVVPLKDKIDISGTKMLKVYEFIKSNLEDFVVKKSGWEWDKKKTATFWFLLKNKKIEDTVEHKGPLLSMKNHVDAFKKKHKKTFIKGKRIYSIDKRIETTPEKLLNRLIKEEYVKERVDFIRRI